SPLVRLRQHTTAFADRAPDVRCRHQIVRQLSLAAGNRSALANANRTTKRRSRAWREATDAREQQI
ncbi:hypothetical protein, partial [Mesorhizobium sp. M1A.F.Ca.IN.022.04.1.1]|uniref:hypothetical protein n=1 Tax=Mesorhizobium sp. M1A.F.Ca.IN.022.04.1.1 TaxID=2496773 RepID=UPI0019CF6A52